VDRKYLYWLGAGASALALPLVANFEEGLSSFKKKVKITTFQIENSTADAEKTKASLLTSIEWLLSNLSEHSSVDTFAKKLYFKRDREHLQMLKAVLSCFFVAEQSTVRVDYRYDSFFASILEFGGFRPPEIPENIKFLSWNYDLQLEKAYFGYVDDNSKVIKELTLNNRLYHLNGYCGTTQRGHIGKEFTETFITKPKITDVILELYNKYMVEGSEPDIDFAWEMNENYFNSSIGAVTNDVKEVIIIGYSFPFFNREIDKKVFEKLSGVDKIFVQAPRDYITGIIERIDTISQDIPKPIGIEDTSQFYIPFDYNLK